MAEIIFVNDLPAALQSDELIHMMVDGANAKASRVAPCLASTDPAPSVDLVNEAKLILLGAVKRWVESGAGSLQSQQAGPFGMTVDTRQRGGFNLWPTEITNLQALCKSGNTGAFGIDMLGSTSAHLPWCDLMFGGTTCSCGVSLTGDAPIYEQG